MYKVILIQLDMSERVIYEGLSEQGAHKTWKLAIKRAYKGETVRLEYTS